MSVVHGNLKGLDRIPLSKITVRLPPLPRAQPQSKAKHEDQREEQRREALENRVLLRDCFRLTVLSWPFIGGRVVNGLALIVHPADGGTLTERSGAHKDKACAAGRPYHTKK